MSSQTEYVSLHLFGVSASRIPAAMVRTAVDRPRLARTPGLSFWKLLGTGRGQTFSPGDAEPRRWGLLAVWAQPEDLLRFERSSPTAAAWRGIAEECWRADMVCVRSRGTWAGREPFRTPVRGCEGLGGAARAGAGGDGPQPEIRDDGGPVAAITRARLRLGRMRAFRAAVPPVAVDLAGAPGLRLGIGIGEAPLGLQGTFSLWDSARSLTDFAYRRAPHRAVVDRTGPAGWYAEELFARFSVRQTSGTVGGRDPLAA